MTTPATDEQIAELDRRYYTHDGNHGPSSKNPVIRMFLSEFDALRARLDQEIAARETAERHTGSDLEERQYWEERYRETRDQLAAAEVVAEAAATMLYPSKRRWSEDAQQLHDAIATYRQKYQKETNE